MDIVDSTRRSRYILALYEGRIDGKLYSPQEIGAAFGHTPVWALHILTCAASYKRSVAAMKNRHA